MKHLLMLATLWVVALANTVNYCGQNSCCSTSSCNTCANNCRGQCSSEVCTNSCINNCIQSVPQTCTGGSCNVCSGSQCCGSQSCNTCANTCTSQCTTQVCRNNCVNKCIEPSPTCPGQNCNNMCVGGQCCNNQNCNHCVNQCHTQTTGCTRACVRQCIQTEPVKVDIPIPEKDCDNLEFVNNFGISDSSKKSSNITTNVDLHNIINNTNHIHVPIRINNTNINNVNYPKSSKPVNKDVTFIKKIESQNQTDGCCYVLHPRECFPVQNKIRCFRRRHRECSSICTSPVVLITPQPVPIPQPYPVPYPINNQQQKCHYTQQPPYVYCGNYQKHDCGDCYYCGKGYQPQQCSSRSQCSSVCRNNLYQ